MNESKINLINEQGICESVKLGSLRYYQLLNYEYKVNMLGFYITKRKMSKKQIDNTVVSMIARNGDFIINLIIDKKGKTKKTYKIIKTPKSWVFVKLEDIWKIENV